MIEHCYACKRPATIFDDRFHVYWCGDDCLGRMLVLLRADYILRSNPNFVDGPVIVKNISKVTSGDFTISGNVVTLAEEKPEIIKAPRIIKESSKPSEFAELIESEKRRKDLLSSLFTKKEP